MGTGPVFWLIMTVGGAVLLGVAMAYALISTRSRRDNPVAQRLTDAATRELYAKEEGRRVWHETADDPAAWSRPDATPTEARQGVTGHNVRYVLGVSLALAAIAAIGLGYFWLHPAFTGGQ
jgi:Flp pilus assembly protein TadB